MQRDHGCHRIDHALSRRGFLATGAAAGAAGLASPALSGELQAKQKRVLQIYLQGGVSQLESWDPKPHTEFGGPFRALPTSVPGLHISELLPNTAKQMHRLSLVRNLHTVFEDHSRAVKPIQRGPAASLAAPRAKRAMKKIAKARRQTTPIPIMASRKARDWLSMWRAGNFPLPLEGGGWGGGCPHEESWG